MFTRADLRAAYALGILVGLSAGLVLSRLAGNSGSGGGGRGPSQDNPAPAAPIPDYVPSSWSNAE